MNSLQCMNFISSKRIINAALHVPKRKAISLSIPKLPIARKSVEEFNIGMRNEFSEPILIKKKAEAEFGNASMATAELYMILESVADRIQMHKNVGEQRDNWNTLLLNSINMITLTATTMAAIASTGGMELISPLRLSSTLLFSAATGMLILMNKIQPSQLAEEQRNATRLFRQIYGEIKTILDVRNPTEFDVKVIMENVLALDQAYPLPLLGSMIEKFPEAFEPAVWRPRKSEEEKIESRKLGKNGWSEELESEMREIMEIIKNKDSEDYARLGNVALKINKTLAISGPLLTGIAAIGSAFIGSPAGYLAAAVGGAMAAVVNTLEHGGQVGMVFEMYRNCGGFFRVLEESIESTIGERDLEKRENGEVFEMKVAMELGRSLTQLRDLAKKSRYCRVEGTAIDEFGSKLF